jgi:hypothetical protein
MINIIAIILCATLLTIALPQISFKQQNAIDALALDNQKASNTIGQACQGSDVICVGAGNSLKNSFNLIIQVCI